MSPDDPPVGPRPELSPPRPPSPSFLGVAAGVVGAFLNLGFWGLTVWGMPIVAVASYAGLARNGVDASIVIIIALISGVVLIPVGLALRWLSKGVIGRRTVRMLLSAAMLFGTTLAAVYGLAWVVATPVPGWVEVAVFLFWLAAIQLAAAVALCAAWLRR